MLVLWKDQRSIGGETRRNAVKRNPRSARPAHPQVHARNPMPLLQQRCREIELPIQLERPGLHGKGPGGRSRGLGLVDDAHSHTHPGEPQRQHQPGGPGADDQYFTARHAFALNGAARR